MLFTKGCPFQFVSLFRFCLWLGVTEFWGMYSQIQLEYNTLSTTIVFLLWEIECIYVWVYFYLLMY
jgi:hypothetical protein